jgi:hypothetical protein
VHVPDTPIGRCSLSLLYDKKRKFDPSRYCREPEQQAGRHTCRTIPVARFDKPCRPLQVLNSRLTPYKSNIVRGNLPPQRLEGWGL